MTIRNPRDPAARPDIARAFAHIAAGADGDPSADPLAAMRRFVDSYGAVDPRPPLNGVEVRPVLADGVAAEWIIPDHRIDDARLVYLHGGGWVAGSLDSHRAIAAELALVAKMAVLLVDYRLAPEHPFPAGLDDCERALAWAGDHGPEGAAPASGLHIAGDSAGGNLAAATCQRALLQESGRVPDRLVLLSAVLDGSLNPERGTKAHLDANQSGLEMVIGQYLQGVAPVEDPAVSPIHIADDILAGFPPCLLQVSGSEYLLWDSQRFAHRLADVEVRVALSIWPSMPHGWHAFLDLLPEARLALREIANFLRAAPLAGPFA